MAAGRKGPKAEAKPDKKPGANGAGPHGDGDVVEMVKGLAALVAEHALTELIVETPTANITLRRGATGGTAVAAMPMSVPVPMHIPAQLQMPASQGGAPFTSHHAPAASAAANGSLAEQDNSHVVTSPFVGTFYRRPNPDSPNYVDLNEKVVKGTVLCIVEAMKLMNEIEADVAGTIVGVLAEDGAPVEYGQALFKIAPA
jgi:acetyl-CoA carboxylase biotin carboxyl carrier protein